ncbi:hypothetical protein EYZ11_006875 [Aspergillus tanneri]|uniref:Uncharacterized protein n=1 Tax=Aspergillus tanneri TaxID=1220188 RepID=A0A4S3JEE7_9EURO|nr:hypothetical protein EYZ11_006875 [Aspergillus tanneri]
MIVGTAPAQANGAGLDGQQWGTGGSYILGDEDINSDYLNVH